MEESAELITIQTDFIKLDAFLKFANAVGSGGEAKVVIAESLVAVNGESCNQRGKKLRDGDRVSYDGQEYLVRGGP